MMDGEFPSPDKVQGSTRWSPLKLLRYEQSIGVDAPAPTGMLNVHQVAERYGVSVPTIWRWAAAARARAKMGG